jgi:hypothetical protein
MFYVKLGAIALSFFAVTTFVGASEWEEIREKANAMQREAAMLAERGQGEEAENLERQAIAMLEEAERLERRGPDRRGQDVRVREMQQRLEELRLEERELKEIGGMAERLADVRREAEGVERQLHELTHRGGAKAGPQNEMARRLEHMRMAAEHLHQAGLHDIAEEIVKQANAAERELHEQQRPRHDGPMQNGPMHNDPMHNIMRQLEEIRQEVGRLRAEMNELRERR